MAVRIFVSTDLLHTEVLLEQKVIPPPLQMVILNVFTISVHALRNFYSSGHSLSIGK
jgi:hypothetical protein